MEKPKILVVEDEKDVAKVIAINLKLEGMDVIEAYDGAEAIRILGEERPDCVLLDIMLPKISGWDVLKYIKSHPSTTDIPVVMVTAKVAERDQLRGLGAGAVKYITKPFSPSSLIEAIKSVLKPQIRDLIVKERREAIERLQLSTLQRVSEILITTKTLDELAESISKKISTIFETPLFALILTEPNPQIYIFDASLKETAPVHSPVVKKTASPELMSKLVRLFKSDRCCMKVGESNKIKLTDIFTDAPQTFEGYIFPLFETSVVIGAVAIAGENLSLSNNEISLLSTIANQLSMTLTRVMLHENLMDDQKLRRYLLHRTIDAQEAERKRIASEIHDSIMQSLVGTIYKLKALERGAQQNSTNGLIKEIRHLEEELSRNVEELRALLLGLTPPALEELGLIAALREHVSVFNAKTGIKVDLNLPENVPNISKTAKINVYRIIQEALNNVEKHSKAAKVSLSIENPNGGDLKITISDDGAGFKPMSREEKLRSLGIATMRERAELLGGTLQIESEPGKGTKVQLLLPKEVFTEG